MDDGFVKQAAEWYERGRHDIETAQLLFKARGYTDTIAYHIHQALEKYLKGYLVLHAKKPPKIHDLDTLLNQAASFNPRLLEFIDLCEKASRFYIEDRYPPGPPVMYEYNEIFADLNSAIQLIKELTGHPAIS